MQVRLILVGAVLAVTALVTPAAAHAASGIEEVQAFTVLSGVRAFPLSDGEKDKVRGSGTIHIVGCSSSMCHIRDITVTAPFLLRRLCANDINCTLFNGSWVSGIQFH